MQTTRATRSSSTEFLLKASSNSPSTSRIKAADRECVVRRKTPSPKKRKEKESTQTFMPWRGAMDYFSICLFVCFRHRWLDLGDASHRHILTSLKLHLSGRQGGKLQVRMKGFDKQNIHAARAKAFGASSYAGSTDSPPGASECTILNFPPVWRSWKHFPPLRAYLFIDWPKGELHHSWGVTNIYYCLAFHILRVLQFRVIMSISDNNANKTSFNLTQLIWG